LPPSCNSNYLGYNTIIPPVLVGVIIRKFP
jgi:hypothetical protein